MISLLEPNQLKDLSLLPFESLLTTNNRNRRENWSNSIQPFPLRNSLLREPSTTKDFSKYSVTDSVCKLSLWLLPLFAFHQVKVTVLKKALTHQYTWRKSRGHRRSEEANSMSKHSSQKNYLPSYAGNNTM